MLFPRFWTASRSQKMSLGPLLNDLEALGFKGRPRTSTSKDRGIEIIGKRMVEEEIGHGLMMPSDLQRK